jgi:hypothetical protein
MKNLTLVCVLSVFAMFVFSSCGSGRKDYVCSCTVQMNPLIAATMPDFGEFLNIDTTITFEIDDAKERDAENQCKGSEAAYKSIPIVIATCEL